MATFAVEVVNLRKSFDRAEVLRGVSFRLDKGETLVVMGGSGSGKTVLLRHVAGLLRPDAGEVRVFGRNIERRSEEHTSELQSHSDLVCRLLLEKKKREKKE